MKRAANRSGGPPFSRAIHAFDGLWLRGLIGREFRPGGGSARAQRRVERLERYREVLQELGEESWFPPPRVAPCRFSMGPSPRDVEVLFVRDELAIASTLGVESLRGGEPVRARLHRTGREHQITILVSGWFPAFLAPQRTRRLRRESGIGPDHDTLEYPWPRLERAGARPVQFPSRDPVANAVMLARAVLDLRQLVGGLRAHGYSRIGGYGTSLGAYLLALLATTPAELDYLVLDRPVAQLLEPLREASRDPEWSSLLGRVASIYRAVDPMGRSPRLANGCIHLLGGRADGITSIQSVRRLAVHLGGTLHEFPGGHLLSYGRSESLRRAWTALGITSG